METLFGLNLHGLGIIKVVAILLIAGAGIRFLAHSIDTSDRKREETSGVSQ
jgi:uncharacterized membrane protein SpoIIM required for sporulation